MLSPHISLCKVMNLVNGRDQWTSGLLYVQHPLLFLGKVLHPPPQPQVGLPILDVLSHSFRIPEVVCALALLVLASWPQLQVLGADVRTRASSRPSLELFNAKARSECPLPTFPLESRFQSCRKACPQPRGTAWHDTDPQREDARWRLKVTAASPLPQLFPVL